jgi:hypothetical protein
MRGLRGVAVQGAVLAALVLLRPGGGVARADPRDATSTEIKDWAVVCDNLRNCVANGFSDDGDEKMAILQLTRSGAPGASAGATLQLLGEAGGVTSGKPLVLAVDGRAVLTVKADGDGSATFADAQVGPLLGAARNGTSLSISSGGQEVGVISLAGMVAALRFVDDRQGRGGTVTAMVAKGPKPASAVPPQPVPPVVRRAPAVAQDGLPGKPSAAVNALMAKAECEADPAVSDGPPEAYRLSADKVLWQVPCGAGAYNFTSLFVIVDNKGGAARIAPLEAVDDGTAINAAYDPETRILSAYYKGRGIGDCGESDEWAWTGQAFVLTRAASMPACRGQADWPVSFQAKVE